jgi:hypothetical protein
MAEQLNEWGKADLIVPDFLKDVRDGVNEAAEFLLKVLNIANDVLDLIKNFVFDFANPINLIIKELLGLVKSLLNDLRNLGVYVYKDIPTNVSKVFLQERLEGGYEGFEGRLTGAMLNSSDPNNPVFLFSESTKVFALFFYYSAPASLVHKFVKTVNEIDSYFLGSKAPEITALATDLSFSYLQKVGDRFSNIKSSAGVTDSGVPADAVKISWQYPEGAPVPEKAFVDISAYKDGLMPLKVTAGPPHSTSREGIVTPCVDTKGKQIVLYGEHKLEGLPESEVQLFTQIDKPGIEYRDIKDYQITKEIDLSSSFNGFSLSDYVSLTLEFKDLPTKVFNRGVFYVRIRTGLIKSSYAEWQNFNAISKPLEIKKPVDITGFTQLIKHSLIIAMVCKNTPLGGKYGSQSIKVILKTYEVSFRGLNDITDLEYYENSLDKISSDLSKELLGKFTTLPKTFRDDFIERYGTALSSFISVLFGKSEMSAGGKLTLVPSGALYKNGEKLAKTRSPLFLLRQGSKNTGVAVFYGRFNSRYEEQKPVYEVLTQGALGVTALEAAEKVLSVVSSSTVPESAWEAYRVFPRVFPDVEDILQQVNDFFETLLKGFKGIVEKIIGYIEAIQSRIAELQNFILRITALLNALLVRIGSVSSFNVLLVEAKGGQGLMTNFLNADNKPADDVRDLSAGVGLVFGGVPTLLIDTFKFIKENVVSEGEQGSDTEELPSLPDGLEF